MSTIADRFLDFIYEMSFTRKKAEEIITGLRTEFNNHLIKMLAFEKNDATNHWFNELLAWILKIQDISIKPRNKTLKSKDYMEWMFNELKMTPEKVRGRIYTISGGFRFKDIRRNERDNSDILELLIKIHRYIAKEIEGNSYDPEKLRTYLKTEIKGMI